MQRLLQVHLPAAFAELLQLADDGLQFVVIDPPLQLFKIPATPLIRSAAISTNG